MSVLAHPFLNLSYDEQTSKLSLSLAKEFGLKFSGGSDFHSSNKPDIILGRGRGNLRIPREWFEALKNGIN